LKQIINKITQSDVKSIGNWSDFFNKPISPKAEKKIKLLRLIAKDLKIAVEESDKALRVEWQNDQEIKKLENNMQEMIMQFYKKVEEFRDKANAIPEKTKLDEINQKISKLNDNADATNWSFDTITNPTVSPETWCNEMYQILIKLENKSKQTYQTLVFS